MYKKDIDQVELSIEEDLYLQFQDLSASIGLTAEEVIQHFFQWVADPATSDTAKVWLRQHAEKSASVSAHPTPTARCHADQ